MSLFGRGASNAPARKTTRRVRPQLEALEDRTVPAVFNVGASDVATLIADIKTANSNGQSNTINLTASTYDLTKADNSWYGPNGLPAITSNLTIAGNGAVILRDPSLGQNTPFRLFYVSGGLTPGSSPGDLTLQNVTLAGGLAEGGNSGAGGGGLGAGGAIFNQGNLTLSGVTITQSAAFGGSTGFSTSGGGGGGMGQSGQGDNGGGFGGAITGGGSGGAGSGTISGGSGGGGFSQNGQTGSGGNGGVGGGSSGLGGAGGSNADGGADGGGGGAGVGVGAGAGGIFGGGGTAATGGGGGGGVGGGGGDGNAAGASGGGGGFGGGGGSGLALGGGGGFGGGGGASGGSGAGGLGGFGGGTGNNSAGGGGAGLGGAIFNMYGTTTLINCTLAANLAAGGSGGANAGAGAGYGGAIFNLNGTLNLTTTTVASNQTSGSANGGGAIYNLAYGSTPNGQAVQAVVNLTDSILANSVLSNDLVNDQAKSSTNSAVVNATTPNIVMATSTINGATTNGTPNTANPMLGLLGYNGGPTPTMTLMGGSPAQGAGSSGANIPTTDQRGVSRGNVTDLGSFQQTNGQATPTATTVASSSSATGGASVTLTATITTTGSTTPAGTVQFVDTTSGTTLGSAAVQIVNGQAQATLAATLSSGPHAITATYLSSNGLGNSSGSTSISAGSSNQAWLSQAYQDILGRAVDPSGLAFWTGVLNNGATRGQVAYLLQQSTEYRADQIQASFQTLLHRAADAPSLNYFLGLMAQGTKIEQIDAIIAGSNEYLQVRGGGTNLGFLAAVYHDFLNRDITAAETQTWTQAQQSGQNRIQVVQAILNTAEYRTDVVQDMYQKFLHRNADTASLNAFVSFLVQGGDDTVVSSVLIGSQEYFNRASTSSAAA
jgi:hypothetical protein